MINTYNLLGIGVGVAMLIWTLSLVKRDSIMLKFGIPWVVLSIFSIAFSASSSFANKLTRLLGFEKPSNLYLSVTVVSLVALGILLSIEVTKSVKRLEKAAIAIALSEGRFTSEND